MGKKVRQVLRAYATGPILSGAIGWLLVHGLMIFMMGPAAPERPEWRVGKVAVAVFGSAISILILGVEIAGVLKLQFANPRARLVPGFAAPHLIVAGGIIAAAMAGSAWVVAWTSGVSGSAAAALVVVEMAAGVCLPYLGCAGVLAWLVVYVLLVMLEPAKRFVAALILENDPVIIVLALCVGLVALAALAARLTMLREEMREYRWAFRTQTWRPPPEIPPTRIFETRARPERPPKPPDFEMRLMLRFLPAWRARLRLVFMPLQFAQVVFLLWLQSVLQGGAAGTPDYGVLDGFRVFLASCYLIFFAAMIVYRNLAGRRPYLARESLYPVRRADLVGSICLSLAWDTAILAAGHSAGLVAGLALFGGVRAFGALIAPYLLLTLAQYLALYCAVLWLGTLGRVSASIPGLAAVCALSSGLVAAVVCFGGEFRSGENVMMLAIVAVAAVLLPLFAALRRWSRAELG